MKSSELDYELPPELIAQHPADRRDHSRLLVYDRATNDAQPPPVQPIFPGSSPIDSSSSTTHGSSRRVHLRRETGGEVEILLIEALRRREWVAIARPSRRLRVGEVLGPVGSWRSSTAVGGGSGCGGTPDGELPLPPYITEPLDDPDRYQTVYARHTGSAAAPTAGLHFTKELSPSSTWRG